MRILDCKEDRCKHIIDGAPVPIDHLCDECKEHNEQLQSLLAAGGIPFAIDPMIVRGLDYYTKTVFEIIADIDGKITICGGGRYDKLISELDGPQTCSVGFGLGIERLIMLLRQENLIPEAKSVCDVFIASAGEGTSAAAFALAQEFRANGLRVELEYNSRSFKAQFKQAGKYDAKYVVVIGSNELESGEYNVKDMQNSTEEKVKASDVCAYVKERI